MHPRGCIFALYTSPFSTLPIPHTLYILYYILGTFRARKSCPKNYFFIFFVKNLFSSIYMCIFFYEQETSVFQPTVHPQNLGKNKKIKKNVQNTCFLLNSFVHYNCKTKTTNYTNVL